MRFKGRKSRSSLESPIVSLSFFARLDVRSLKDEIDPALIGSLSAAMAFSPENSPRGKPDKISEPSAITKERTKVMSQPLSVARLTPEETRTKVRCDGMNVDDQQFSFLRRCLSGSLFTIAAASHMSIFAYYAAIRERSQLPENAYCLLREMARCSSRAL